MTPELSRDLIAVAFVMMAAWSFIGLILTALRDCE